MPGLLTAKAKIPLIPLIIDTDMAGDDWLAILYLLSQPEVDIRAITVNGTGQAHPKPGCDNLLKLLDLAKAPDIPVATGSEQPYSGDNAFPDTTRAYADQLQGISLPDSKRASRGLGSAASLIIESIENSDTPVTILALGSWTTLAQALETKPKLAERISRIIAMGGAVDVTGNIHSVPTNTTAEWNFYLDPKSVSMVMETNIPIDLIPLDATNQTPVSDELINALRVEQHSPAALFAANVIEGWKNPDCTCNWSMWDPLAAVALVDPEVVEYKQSSVMMDFKEGSKTEGALIKNMAGRKVRYANQVNRELFEKLFIEGLSNLQ